MVHEREERKTKVRTRKKVSWLPVALALLAAVVVAVGCGDDDDEGGEAAGGGEQAAEVQDVKMLMPFKESIAFIGLVVAQDRFYKDLGLNVELPATDGDSFVAQQLVAGKEKFGITGAPELMIANQKGEDLVGIADINRDIFTIVAPSDSEVKSFDQMQGKKLGVTNLGGGEIPLVKGVLKNAGFKENEDVELAVIGEGGPAVASALNGGKIDAFAGAINDIAAIQAAGATGELVPILPEKFEDLPSNEFAVSQEVLDNEQDREIAINLMKGWRMGTEFAQQNPDQALEIACKRVPEDCENMDVAKAYLDVAIAAEEPPQDWGFHDFAKYEVVRDSIAAAQIEGEVDLEQAFTNDYVEEFNAE